MFLRVNDALWIHQIENNQWIIVNQKSGKTAVKLECGFIQVFHFAFLLWGKYQNESHAFFQISLTIPKKTSLFAWSVFLAFSRYILYFCNRINLFEGDCFWFTRSHHWPWRNNSLHFSSESPSLLICRLIIFYGYSITRTLLVVNSFFRKCGKFLYLTYKN